MSLIDRIQTHQMLRRADNVIRNAKREKDRRDHFNRPHVQSDHLISYPVPREKPQTAPDLGIGPIYAACVIALVGLVAYVNFFHPDAVQTYTRSQIASK